MKEERTIANWEIVQLHTMMQDEAARQMAGKALPVKILLAKNSTIPELRKAFSVYWKSFEDLCQQHGVDPGKINNIDDIEDKELKESALELLMTKVPINVYTFPVELLELCGEGKYDALSENDMARIMWMAEEKNNGNSDEKGNIQ